MKNDLLAHIEYYYNTLVASNRTENPFRDPRSYPAFLYIPLAEEQTIFETYREMIFPPSDTTSHKDSMMTSEHPASNESPQQNYWLTKLMDLDRITITSSSCASASPDTMTKGRRKTQLITEIKHFNGEANNMSPMKPQTQKLA